MVYLANIPAKAGMLVVALRIIKPASIAMRKYKNASIRSLFGFKNHPGKNHGFLDSECNDYNKRCFKDLSEPAVFDMIDFLHDVFKL
jgi:hypothetical protein